MDISIDNKISVQPLRILEGSANKPVASKSQRVEPEEADRGKTSESEMSRPVDNQEVKQLAKKLQEYVDRLSIKITFSTYGEQSKKTAVTVSEKETGKLIREIPPEDLQRLHVKMEELAGMIFNGMV